jgi:hypothetical protein
MLNFFKKRHKQETCNFCNISVDKSQSFVLQYKSADGLGNMTVCKECANVFNEIIDVRNSINEEIDD